MKTINHYLSLFEQSDMIGRQLVARAIYAGRYGNADDPAVDVLRDLTRELPERLDRDEAIKLAKASSAWRDFLDRDPIPPWALRLGIQAAGLTQAQFAEKMGLSLRAVQYYLSGERAVTGASAKLASIILS